MSQRAAARLHGIPASSFRDHLTGKTPSRHRGKHGVLSVEEDKLLVEWIMRMQTIEHPIAITHLRLKVVEIIQFCPTLFKMGVPGQGWVKWFRRRHPELSLRRGQGLEVARARNLCPASIASFYRNL